MSMEDVVEQTAGVIPVVVTAGVAMKMTDWLFQREQQVRQQSVTAPRGKRKKNVYSRNYSGGFGDFSNIGW